MQRAPNLDIGRLVAAGCARDLAAFGDSDPITGPMAPIFVRHIPGTGWIEHPVLSRAGHFLQEDAREELAEHVIRFVRS